MASVNDFLSDQINHAVQRGIQRQLGNVVSPYFYGTFVATEAADANLSKITVAGNAAEFRFVPRLAHVTGLTAGETVLCVKGKGVPLTIIGRVVGDISLASV